LLQSIVALEPPVPEEGVVPAAAASVGVVAAAAAGVSVAAAAAGAVVFVAAAPAGAVVFVAAAGAVVGVSAAPPQEANNIDKTTISANILNRFFAIAFLQLDILNR